MDESLVIAVYYYDGKYYLPTVVRSVDGLTALAAPVVVVAGDDRAALEEEIELKAIAGNPVLTRADFRALPTRTLLEAMHLPNWQACFDKATRWSIVETDGAYALVPFKPAAFRGVVEDTEHAIPLPPATFIPEALDHIAAQIAS